MDTQKKHIRIRPRDALVIVDLQNDFCPGGALPVAGGNDIVPVVNRLIERFLRVPTDVKGEPAIVFTKDWHIDDHDGWPPHCIRGTRGSEFHPDLHVPEKSYVFGKGIGSHEGAYSGFEGVMLDSRVQMPFGFGHKSTEISLEDWLRKLGARRLFVVGLATDYCVKATVLDARNRKPRFKVCVVTDAIAAVNVNLGDGDHALREMYDAGAKLCTSHDILPNGDDEEECDT